MRTWTLPLVALLSILGAAAWRAGAAPLPGSAKHGETAVGQLVADAEVLEPSRYRNLTLFPVRLRRVRDRTDYVTLDEALRRGYLEIRELVDAEVNRVRVNNRSSQHVFLLAGELIAGAKQDRMVEDDALLPPHSGDIALGVYCTEHGRWAGRSADFEAAGAAVHNRLRQVAKESRSQSRVWAEVEAKTGSLGVASPSLTSAAREVYNQSEVRERTRPYVDNLEGFARRHADGVGVIAAAGGEILVADVFANPELFRRLWPKLLESYALDAVDRSGLTRPVERGEAERFLKSAAGADTLTRRTPGAGDLYDLRSARVSGSALVYREAVLHLDLFPRLTEEPQPTPRVPNLQQRRERRVR